MKGLIVTTLLLSISLTGTVLLAGEVRVDPDQTHLLLATQRSSTMADEIAQAAQLGFRIVMGSPTRGDEFAYLLERTDQPYDRDQFRLLATRRVKTMERELNETSREGYRLVPRSVLWPECDELMLVLERTAREDPVYEYLILETRRTSTLQKEISEAVDARYQVVSMQGGRENLVILERQQNR